MNKKHPNIIVVKEKEDFSLKIEIKFSVFTYMIRLRDTEGENNK